MGEVMRGLATISRDLFERYATHEGDAAAIRRDGHWVHARQIELARWQAANFDEIDDRNLALGIAEESGELSEARNGPDVEDAMGDVAIFLGQLLHANRMSLEPVITGHPDDSSLRDAASMRESVGRICHVVLKGRQKIRGFEDPAVYRIQLLLAGWDVAVSHGVTPKIYLQVSERVLARSWR